MKRQFQSVRALTISERYPAPRGGKGTFGCRAARPSAEHLDALSRRYAALGIVGNQTRGVDHGGGTGQ